MNQTDLIQKVMAADRQAQAITQDAKQLRDNIDAHIAEEIEAMKADYQEKSEAYLRQLKASAEEKSSAYLEDLDRRLEKKLSQVENLYQAKKDEWVDAIFVRIVGKAGD